MKQRVIKDMVYQKFINYSFSVCNQFSLTKIIDSHAEENRKIIEIILREEQISEEEFFQKYSEEYLNLLISKYYYNEKIFKDYNIKDFNVKKVNFSEEINSLKNEFKSFKDFKKYYEIYENINISVGSYEELNYENFFSKIIYDERRIVIEEAINVNYYENFTNLWLEKNRNNIIKEQEEFMFGKKYGIKYFFDTIPEMESQLLVYNDIFDISYPKSLENLCFYKNDKLWFSFISHERDFYIICSNKNEYDYLKEIGLSTECLVLN